MDIVFEKIPLQEYLTFFKTGEEDEETLRWIEIQYEYLIEPSWASFNTFELYCPTNISIAKGTWFSIPTGFRCTSDYEKVICIPCFELLDDVKVNKEIISQHIILSGTAKENHCFQVGDRLLKLKFGG